jgi:DNA-binding MarR family transcriptional regulator
MTDSVQFTEDLRKWVELVTHRSMGDQARYVKSVGFSMQQFFLLMHIHYRGQCGVSDLGERMDITAPAASQLVDKLFQSGLVERAEDPHDRRAKQITLSAKGRALIEAGIEERYRWVEDLTIRLSAKEQEKVGEALALLMRASQHLEMHQPVKSG